MAGGWAAAALLPVEVSLAQADEHLRRELMDRHTQALQFWASAFAFAEERLAPPEPPEELFED